MLEDLAPGRPGEAELPQLLDWAVELAGPPGPPLERSAEWAEHAKLLRGQVPDEALATVAGLPSRHMHGDLQPKNVLASGGRLTAIDWEGAWREGIPGLDVVYLALFAHGLDPAVLADPPEPVRAALARVGVGDDALPAALYVMLGTWATAEDRRRVRLGSQPGEPFFRPLLAKLGPGLR